MVLRSLLILVLQGSLLLALASATLLLLVGLGDRRAAAQRISAGRERIRDRLGVDPLDPAQVTARVAESAELRTREGYPWLVLRGSPYQRGFAHGHALRERIAAFHTDFLSRVARDAAEEAARWHLESVGLPLKGRLEACLAGLLGMGPVRGLVRDALLDRVADQLAVATPERFREELLGIADGAGLDPRIVERFHAVAEVASAGCSNLAAWGSATRDGHFLQYRNLDWSLDLGVQDHAVVVEHVAEGGHRGHLTLGFAGFAGALQGLNDAGITLGEVGAGSSLVSYRGQPMVFRLRRILEEAGSLDDAERILREGNRTKGYNFLIGDLRRRQARAFETNAAAVASFGADDPAEAGVAYARRFPDAVLRGDVAVDPGIRRLQHAAEGPGDPRQAWSYRYRYALLADMLGERLGRLDAEGLEAIARASGEKSRNLVMVLYLEDRVRFAYARGPVRASDQPLAGIAYRETEALADLGPREGD